MHANIFSKSASKTMPTMQQASDELLHSAGRAMDSTRDYASEALSKAENKLRDSVDPVVDRLASKAQRMARHSLDLASEAKDHAEQSLRHATRVSTRYVANQPLRSVLAAAAVGAAVALLIASSRHRNPNR